jgi:hypothetical protein
MSLDPVSRSLPHVWILAIFGEKFENVCGYHPTQPLRCAVLTGMLLSAIRKEIADKLTITTVNLFNGFATSSFSCTYNVLLCYPRTLTTFRFPFPLGIPPAAPCPSVAFMPARMVSISTPDGNAGECADTRDLRAG